MMALPIAAVLTPEQRRLRRRLAIRRALKVAVYTVVGYVLVSAVALFVYALMRLDVDAALIAIGTPIVAGIVAGFHKALSFKAEAIGMTLPDIPGSDDTHEMPGGLQ